MNLKLSAIVFSSLILTTSGALAGPCSQVAEAVSTTRMLEIYGDAKLSTFYGPLVYGPLTQNGREVYSVEFHQGSHDGAVNRHVINVTTSDSSRLASKSHRCLILKMELEKLD